MEEFFDYLMAGEFMRLFDLHILPQAINIILGIIVFFIGKFLVKKLSFYTDFLIQKRNNDEILAGFIRSILDILGLFIVGVIALSQVGFDTSSLVAVLGAAGIAIGLSLKSSLQNLAAGIMIIVFKPFVKGNFIEAAGVSGTVMRMNLLATTLRAPDNKEIIVPNGTIFNSSITNYSSTGERRVDLVIDVSYDTNLKQAKQLIEGVLAKEHRILTERGITVVVGALGDSGVQLFVRIWSKTSDYWQLRWSLLEEIKATFDTHGIEIPYNKLDVTLLNAQNKVQ